MAKERVTYLAGKYPYWGRGDAPKEARREYRKAGGSGRPTVIEVRWVPRSGESGGPYVDDMGAIRVPGKFVGKPRVL